jgi:multidrug efflux pump subunit AcrB
MTDSAVRPVRDRGPIAWMAHNRVTPNLLMLVFLLGGLFTAFQIKQEVFPDFEIDMVRISVTYANASPEEVEKGIILAVESAVSGVEGIKEINATATEGRASVVADLIDGADRQKVFEDIRQEVERISTLPEDAEDPVVSLVSRRREVLNVELFGQVADTTLRGVAEDVRDRLLQDPGITQIDFVGARDYEIQIEIPQAKLRAYGLTVQEVASRIGSMAVEVPGGSIEAPGGDILLRVNDRRDQAHEFASIPIVGTEAGTIVRLGDIATVREALEDTDIITTFDGKPAIRLAVFRVGDQTPIGVSKAVRAALADVQGTLPPGIDHAISRDRSEIYTQRLELLLKNGFMGLALVLVLLGAFLEFKLAFWVTMGIPTSFLGALLFLPGTDTSINMISMFAFIIALGIVVDDAIVAGENIYENRQRGMSFTKAAIQGARDISVPIGFSILTNVVAFLPLYFIPGMMGKVFGVIPIVVVSVFLVSWIEALFILPAHLAHSRPGAGNPVSRFLVARQEKIAGLLVVFIERVYQPVLRRCVSFRYGVVASAVAIFVLTVAFTASGRLGFVLMPRAESDTAIVTAVLRVGSPVDKGIAVRDQLMAAAKTVADANGAETLVESVFAKIDENEVEIRLNLTDADVRPISTAQMTRLWRKEVGPMAGLESLKFESDRGGPGSGSSLNVELSHGDIDVLNLASADLARQLAGFPVVSDVDDGSAAGKRQVSFRLRPEGISLGLTGYDVARQIRAAFYGTEALSQQNGRNEVKVLVRLPEAERGSMYDIEQFLLRTPAGTDVPLRHVADVSWGRAYTSISRRDGRRTVTVTADVSPISENNKVKATLMAETLPALQRDYPGLTYGFRGRHAHMADSMSSLLTSFILAFIAIYILLAIPFRDYAQPIIVVAAMPLGFVGAVMGHLVMGYSLSVISIMGIVALSGVVINDSLVMIDYANRQRAAGQTPREAIILAGMRRFRPIILTTLTTFGGLAPMIFETSRQARFMIPMAISLGYGILVATAIILIFVPSLYMIVEDLRDLVGLTSERDKHGQPETA